MRANPGRTAVYRPYDAVGHLLYVGVAEIPESRWKQHARESQWWPLVDGTPKIEWFDTRKEAEAAELAAIRAEGPLFNVVGTPKHGRWAIKRPTGPVHDGTAVGAAEVAVRLGVSRQRVQQLAARPDFPQPIAELGMGRLWDTAEVEAWIRDNRPPGEES